MVVVEEKEEGGGIPASENTQTITRGEVGLPTYYYLNYVPFRQ